MSNNDKKMQAFDQKKANMVAQLLNIIFNNSTFYGGNHPSTQKSADEFIAFMQDIFDIIPIITLMRTGDSLYIDKWCVDQKMNVARLVKSFRKIGLESISFRKGVVGDEVKKFIAIFSDWENYNSVDKIKEELSKQGVTKIDINYVYYQRVTKDEAIVNKKALASQKKDDKVEHGATPIDNRINMFNQLGKLFSLNDLIKQPEQIADQILKNSSGKNGNGNSKIINQLKGFNKQIKSGEDDFGSLSVDEVMESVIKLSSELKQGLEIQKEMGKINQEDNLVVDEINKLTYQTIVKLVRDEYRNGNISVKRLSNTIHRVLPDIKDLKRLLPKLKEGLLADGMSLKDFLQLTNELSKELQSEGLVNALESSADAIGLSVEEIVKAISSNPDEAAKLIVLASEIKQGTGSNQLELSKLLSDYIEAASSKMALESTESKSQSGGKVLEKVVNEINNRLLSKLKTENIADDVVSDVEAQLSKRFPKTLEKLKEDWIFSVISDSNSKDFSGNNSNFIRMLNSIIDKEEDFNSLKNPLENALRAQGINQSQVNSICNEMIKHFGKKRERVSLSKFLLSSNNTTFFLQRQIKEFLRYGNPFSCISISITAVNYNNSWHVISSNEISRVLPEVCSILKKLLRDLDLIGSLGSFSENNIIVILPMTNEAGALAARKRLTAKFEQSKFTIGNKSVGLNIVVSVTPFDKKKTPDFKSYRHLVNIRHKIEEGLNNRL